VQTRSLTAATTLAALALVTVTACSAPAAPPAEGAPAPSAAAGAADAGTGAQGAALGQALTAATGLAALGGLGQDQGAGDQVRGLGGQLSSDADALTAQLRTLAEAQGVAVTDALTPEQQAQLADLGARTGQPFDQAWLNAAGEALAQARSAAEAVLASPDASPEARAAAEEALARLDALAASLADASTAAGADAPTTVDAGNGGQAAPDAPLLAIGLLGGGVALVGGAAALRRRQVS
jgi:predicted outer membrane protein